MRMFELFKSNSRTGNISSLSLLRSAMAGHLYKHYSKHTSNSGFDLTFMPCSCYILFAAEQRAGYQISWVDPQREVTVREICRATYSARQACLRI